MKICDAEKLLVSKYFWKRYIGIKASFEGKEGRAVKRIPDLCGREAKGTTTVTISVEIGDARCSIIRRRAQRPRRDIDLDKISQVLRDSVSDYFYLILCSMGSHRMLCSTMQSY